MEHHASHKSSTYGQWPQVLEDRWQDVITGSSSLNFFQAVFTWVVTARSQSLAVVAEVRYHLQIIRSNLNFALLHFLFSKVCSHCSSYSCTTDSAWKLRYLISAGGQGLYHRSGPLFFLHLPSTPSPWFHSISYSSRS